MNLNKCKLTINHYIDIVLLIHKVRSLQKEYLLSKLDTTLIDIRALNKLIDDALIILNSKELEHNSIVAYFNTVNNCSIVDTIKHTHTRSTTEFIESICRPHYSSIKNSNLYMFLYDKYFKSTQSVHLIKFTQYHVTMKIQIKNNKFKLYVFDVSFILRDFSIVYNNCIIFNREFI